MDSSAPASRNRRQFLGTSLALAGAGLAATGAGLLLPRRALADNSWQNWSGGQTANPANVFYPATEADLVKAVTTGKGPVRAFGGGHSFSGIVPSAGTLISLEMMTGLIAHDPAKLQATLGAGTRLAIAGELLTAAGQNLQNEPDINMQSLAGAISTATHGTGTTLTCLSAYVTQLKLVLADGSVVTCSKEKDPELFEAARVGVGSIGIISEITFQNRAAYKLAEQTSVMDLDEAYTFIEQRKGIDRHVEIMVFPHGSKALVKQMNITTDPDTPEEKPTFDENDLLRLAADTVNIAPFTKGLIQKLLGAFVEEKRRVGNANRIFPSVRSVQFNEMEYTVPAEKGIACLREVVQAMQDHELPVFFPVEFRYVAADDTWMSMFSERSGASISIHQYYKQDYREVFDVIEPILRKHQGRPHWGKLHTLTAKELQPLYPHWENFMAVRQRVDPKGRFLTPYMRNLFGVPA